ncbi:porin family protein, partial [Candidatus Zixiibacteriota bacterium]
MKQLFLGILIILLSINVVPDQAIGQVSSSYIGIIGGQNRANLEWEEPEYPDIEYSTRSGAVFGGVLGITLGGNLDLRLEPSYLQKGAKREHDDLEMGLVKSSIDLSYVELPVLLQWSFNREGINPYLLAGGAASYLLEATEKYGDDYQEFGYESSYDIKKDLTTWDYGYSYGGGISIPFSGFSLFLEGRYSKGVKDINNVEDFEAEIFTEGMEYLAGITIPIGGGDDVFFQRAPGAAKPKMETSTRTRERRGKCEIGAELAIRIVSPLGKIISGKKKILFNVLKPGVQVDSNCQVVVQAQNSA